MAYVQRTSTGDGENEIIRYDLPDKSTILVYRLPYVGEKGWVASMNKGGNKTIIASGTKRAATRGADQYIEKWFK